MVMKINVTEARADIVRYYENKGYSHNHAESHVPHDPNQVMRIYNLIQEENKTNPLVPDDGADGLLFVQKQVELDRFGQSRLSGRSLLLYNYEDNGGLWENLRFSPLSLLGEDETSVSFVLRTHSTMFHLLH